MFGANISTANSVGKIVLWSIVFEIKAKKKIFDILSEAKKHTKEIAKLMVVKIKLQKNKAEILTPEK